MSFSRAEVMALATKAARGAGAPPAQAAQFGRACVVHLGCGRSESDLIGALEALPRGVVVDLPAALEEIMDAGEAAEVTVSCSQELLQSYVESLPFKALCDGFSVKIDPTSPAQKPAATRLDIDEAIVARLEDWAARTYVPESETSRRGGAGGGLSDND